MSFRIALIASARHALLYKNLNAICSNFKNAQIYVFADMPSNRSRTFKVRHMLRSITQRYTNVESVLMERHIGTRGMWLSILSMKTPMLIVEDDVFLSKNADVWYRYCIHTMNYTQRLFGCSFTSQTTVATKNAGYTFLKQGTPYEYPLIGSHGFMISPHHHQAFVDQLLTRHASKLMIPNLITTQWYKDFERRKLTGERMWTQEAVAYTYHNQLTTLYPPSDGSFAKHCARDHAVDLLISSCHRFSSETQKHNVSSGQRLPILGWDALCRQNCRMEDIQFANRVSSTKSKHQPVKASLWYSPRNRGRFQKMLTNKHHTLGTNEKT